MHDFELKGIETSGTILVNKIIYEFKCSIKWNVTVNEKNMEELNKQNSLFAMCFNMHNSMVSLWRRNYWSFRRIPFTAIFFYDLFMRNLSMFSMLCFLIFSSFYYFFKCVVFFSWVYGLWHFLSCHHFFRARTIWIITSIFDNTVLHLKRQLTICV